MFYGLFKPCLIFLLRKSSFWNIIFIVLSSSPKEARNRYNSYRLEKLESLAAGSSMQREQPAHNYPRKERAIHEIKIGKCTPGSAGTMTIKYKLAILLTIKQKQTCFKKQNNINNSKNNHF